MDSIKIKRADRVFGGRACCIHDCNEVCSIDIETITGACARHSRLCLAHFKELRRKMDALNVLVQTGFDTREDT